jgi:hypothetical protein
MLGALSALPDDVPSHPYAVDMETAMLAPNAEVSFYPWKEPKTDTAGGAAGAFVPACASACQRSGVGCAVRTRET